MVSPLDIDIVVIAERIHDDLRTRSAVIDIADVRMIWSTYADLFGSIDDSCNNSWIIYENSRGKAFRTFERVYFDETLRHTFTSWFNVIMYQSSKSFSTDLTKTSFSSG